MATSRLTLALAGLLIAAVSASAAQTDCLSKEERRAVLATGKVVPLGEVIDAVEPRGEVVRARLCESGNGFVYLLTLLSRDGKVSIVTVDAASGRLAGR